MQTSRSDGGDGGVIPAQVMLIDTKCDVGQKFPMTCPAVRGPEQQSLGLLFTM